MGRPVCGPTPDKAGSGQVSVDVIRACTSLVPGLRPVLAEGQGCGSRPHLPQEGDWRRQSRLQSCSWCGTTPLAVKKWVCRFSISRTVSAGSEPGSALTSTSAVRFDKWLLRFPCDIWRLEARPAGYHSTPCWVL